jgi:hypothetical protein
VQKIRKLSCSFQEKGNYLLKIQSKLDISTIEVYMARKHSPRIPKVRSRPAQQLFFWIKIVVVQESLCRVCAVLEIKLTGNLNLFNFNSQVLMPGG